MDLVGKPGGKSIVWLYFGLKADEKGQPLNSNEAICRLCRKIVLSKGGNTTNLRSHLKRRHRAYLFDNASSTSSGAFFDTQALDISHEEFFDNEPLLQAPLSQTSYVPDAALPLGEPWLHGGPSRAALSLPSCLCLCRDIGSNLSGPGASGEELTMELKVYAKCHLQQGVLFGPFLGELCRGQMPADLKYAWAIREDASFIYVDASDENKSNWMRYVTYASSEEKHNLVVFQFHRHIYYRVSQPVSEGAELRVWIGQAYGALLGLGMGDNVKCEVGDKETALRLLQDIQLVTLPEPSSTSLWSENSQSQSPMPAISGATTGSNPDVAVDPAAISDSALPSNSLMSFPSLSSFHTKYDFVPGTEKLLSYPHVRQTSPWYFFGFVRDPTGQPLDQSSAVCKLCVEHVSCLGGTADLESHLISKHDLRLRDLCRERTQTTGQQRSLSAVVTNGSVSTPPHALPTQVTNAIVNFLVADLQPPALVEGDGFRQLIHTLLPACRELPSPSQLETFLKDHHASAKGSLLLQLRRKRGHRDHGETSDIAAPIQFEPGRCWPAPSVQREVSHFVTLSVDVWVHNWQGNAERYLTLWAHFIDSNFSFRTLALATQRLTESGANSQLAVEGQAKAMAQEWGVSHPNLILLGGDWKNQMRPGPIKREKDREAAGSLSHPNSTTFLERDDSASPEEASEVGHSCEGPTSVPCFFSAVQGCVEMVMLHPAVSKALRQFQVFLSSLFLPPAQSQSSIRHHARRLLQVLTTKEHAGLRSWAHCSPSWNTLYPLLSTLVKHKSILCNIVKDLRSEVSHKDDIASESSSSGSCCTISTSYTPAVSVPNLNPEWKVVEDLCLVLKPLDVACRTLAKENFPRLSLVKPILTGLLSRHLVSRPADSSVLKEAKKMMRRHLASCYDNPAVNRALSVACSLDPQFHRLGFMEEKEQTATLNFLKNEALRIVKADRKRSRGKKHSRSKRSPSPGSPDSDSNSLRRSKRLKECQPISYKQLGGVDAEDGEDVEDGEDGESDIWEPEEEEPAEPGSQGGVSGMEFLLGDLFSCPPSSGQSSVEESLDMELSVFKAEKGASLGVEPLHWWRTKAAQLPLLATVARAYLAAPAAAGNAALDFLEDGAASRKKSNIPPDNLDAILFLHYNQKSVAKSGRTAARGDDKSSGGEKDP